MSSSAWHMAVGAELVPAPVLQSQEGRTVALGMDLPCPPPQPSPHALAGADPWALSRQTPGSPQVKTLILQLGELRPRKVK